MVGKEAKYGETRMGLSGPEKLLIDFARLSFPNPGEHSELLANGRFPCFSKTRDDESKLIIDGKNRVVLIRYANDERHLIKDEEDAGPEEMKASVLNTVGGYKGVVHTSADIARWYLPNYDIFGIFKIPVRDFLNNVKKGKIILGSLSEREIVLAGKIAKKYLTKVGNNNRFNML